MNNQEAIKFFKESQIDYSNIENGIKAQSVCDLAIEALNKQIQTPPLKNTYEYGTDADGNRGIMVTDIQCPSCENDINGEVNYCENCGQAIDWSESDE